MEDVDLESEVSLRAAARAESIGGGQGYFRCNCSGNCKTKRCKCFKENLKCNSRCHNQRSCSNKDQGPFNNYVSYFCVAFLDAPHLTYLLLFIFILPKIIYHGNISSELYSRRNRCLKNYKCRYIYTNQSVYFKVTDIQFASITFKNHYISKLTRQYIYTE